MFLWVSPAWAQRAEIVWFAPLVEIRTNTWAPAIEQVRNGITGSFPCVWKSSRLPQHWAVGLAEVDTAQLAAVQADTRITVFTRVEAANTLSTVPLPTRTQLTTYTSEAGIPEPRPGETVLTLINRLAEAARQRTNAIDGMDVLLQVEIRVYKKLRGGL